MDTKVSRADAGKSIIPGSHDEIEYARHKRYYKVHGITAGSVGDNILNANISLFAKECVAADWPFIVIRPDNVKAGSWKVTIDLPEMHDSIDLPVKEAILGIYKKVKGGMVRYIHFNACGHVNIGGLTMGEAETIAFRAFDAIGDIVAEILGD